MNTSTMRNLSPLVDLSDSSDSKEKSFTRRSRRHSSYSTSNFNIAPLYTGAAEYRYLVVDLEDIEFESLAVDIPAEPEAILKAVVHYVMHDDDYYLGRLLDELIPEDEVSRAMRALDQWIFLFQARVLEVFDVLRRVAPMRVNHAILKGRFVRLECTYEEFILA